MPTQILLHSALSSLQLVPYAKQVPARYHTVHANEGWYEETRLPDEDKLDYDMPVQLADRLFIQVHGNWTSAPTLDVFDTHGNKLLAALSLYYNGAVTGNVYDLNGTPIALSTAYWHLKLSSYASINKEGFYYIRVNASYTDAIVKQMISERFHAKADWPATVLLEASDTSNRPDLYTIFDVGGAPVFPQLRIPGALYNRTPKSERTIFIDQGGDATQLYGRKYQTTDLGMGAVPDYMIEKVNAYLDCDTLLIDGKQFVADEGAQLEVEADKLMPLKVVTIALREAENIPAASIVESTVPIYTTQANYPYAIAQARLTNGTNILTLPKYVVNDATALQAYCDYLNLIAFVYGLEGTYAIHSGNKNIIYTNTATEHWAQLDSRIYTAHWDFTVAVTTTNQLFNVQYQYPNLFSSLGFGHMIEWGDNALTAFVVGSPIPTTYTTVPHTYAVIDDYEMRIWYDAKLSRLNISNNSGGTLAKVTGISGNAPAALEAFFMLKQNVTALNLDFLLNCYLTLSYLQITESNVTNIDAGVFQDSFNAHPSQLNFKALRAISLVNNTMTSTAVDNILIGFADWATVATPQTGLFQPVFYASGQTPLAVPTSASASARGFLTAMGWDVQTDV